MVPSQQCFKSIDLIFREIDDGLVKDFELSCSDGFAEIKFNDASSLGPGVHFGFEEMESSTAIVLRPVQGHISIPQKLIRIVAVIRCNRDPNARADHYMMIAEV